MDNDADGKVDLADLGCVGVTDNDETDPQVLLVPASAGPTATPLLSPFPVVRMRGRILSSGVAVSILSVRAPKGSKVTIVCRGSRRSCPRSRLTKTMTTSTTRLRAFERRMRSGTVLRIYVTKAGFVGKYTRFTVRRNRAPLRADACSRPNNTLLICP